jgi:hypothetical protein
MIDSYEFGSITVDGAGYRCDVIVFPGRVVADWWRESGHRLVLKDLEEVLRYGPRLLIVGQGKFGHMAVDREVQAEARRRGIELFTAPTDRAVEEYNRRFGENRVVAALHLTC